MAEPTPPPLPSELPVLPLRRTVAFPLTLQPLAVNRPVSIETVNRALATDRLVLLLLQDTEEDDPGPEDLKKIGTVGVIRQMAKVGGGINVIIEGVARVRADVVTRYRHVDAGADHAAAGALRAHDRGRGARPPHPGADREGAVARHRAVRRAAWRRHEHRRPAAPGLRAGDAHRHEAGRQAGAARGGRAPQEAAGGRRTR